MFRQSFQRLLKKAGNIALGCFVACTLLLTGMSAPPAHAAGTEVLHIQADEGGEYYAPGTYGGDTSYEPDEIQTVTICKESGMLATPDCPDTEEVEYNITQGEAPPEYYCSLHNSDTATYPIGPTDDDGSITEDDAAADNTAQKPAA